MHFSPLICLTKWHVVILFSAAVEERLGCSSWCSCGARRVPGKLLNIQHSRLSSTLLGEQSSAFLGQLLLQGIYFLKSNCLLEVGSIKHVRWKRLQIKYLRYLFHLCFHVTIFFESKARLKRALDVPQLSFQITLLDVWVRDFIRRKHGSARRYLPPFCATAESGFKPGGTEATLPP